MSNFFQILDGKLSRIFLSQYVNLNHAILQDKFFFMIVYGFMIFLIKFMMIKLLLILSEITAELNNDAETSLIIKKKKKPFIVFLDRCVCVCKINRAPNIFI